ncbi:MAG: AEC family transporter [Bacteriovoracia bacterium]
MASLITLAVSLLLGVGLQRIKNIPQNAPATLGSLILYVPLPAVCLLSLPDLEWNLSLISLALVTWIIFGIAFFLFPHLGKKYGWGKDVVGCLILTAGFCNSAFVGFPVIESLYGMEALKHALFLDQSGSFLIVSSFGIWVAITYSTGKMRKRVLFKKILLFPPFIAFLAGLLMGVAGIRPEGVVREVLERLAALLTPLALICVGLQLKWNEIHEERRFLTLGLSYKLLIAPFFIFLTYYFGGVDKNILRVAVMEAGMAPMITSSILAASHNLRPGLAGMMVGVGVPLSGLTLALWYYLLKLV